MAMLDMSRQLLHGWETSDMEDGDCEEAGLQRQTASIQALQRRNQRLRQMAQCLAAGILLLFLVTLASVIMAVHALRVHRSPDGQPPLPPVSPSSGLHATQQQRKELTNPYAMLTAPRHNITDGKYLNWETEIGNAFLRGGFIYSGGDLVVPREGIYRLFLQITYESKTCNGQRLELKNDVMVFHDGYLKDVSLLQSYDTVNCSMGLWKKSLYTSGLFKLDANSILRVTSSKPDHIMKNEKLTFFGAEFVSVI